MQAKDEDRWMDDQQLSPIHAALCEWLVAEDFCQLLEAPQWASGIIRVVVPAYRKLLADGISDEAERVQENGRRVCEWDSVEGRIRQTAGRYLASVAEVMRMEARHEEQMTALATLQRRVDALVAEHLNDRGNHATET